MEGRDDMKVRMKIIELLATKHAQKFTKNWDYFTLSSAGFLAGAKAASTNDNVVVEETILDGEHQLSVATFNKWKEQNKKMSFKDHLTTYLEWFKIEEIRVEEKDGLISFQGTARKKL